MSRFTRTRKAEAAHVPTHVPIHVAADTWQGPHVCPNHAQSHSTVLDIPCSSRNVPRKFTTEKTTATRRDRSA